jgi:Family of unknown function (DUF6152)
MAKLRAAFLLTLLIGMGSASPILQAHHGGANYDKKTTLDLTGTVVNLTLANPHSWVTFDVKSQNGEVDHWIVEFGILTELIPQGWTNDTLKPGDQIKVSLHPKRDGSHGGLLAKEVTYADGRPLVLKPPPGPHPRALHWF